VPPGDQSGASRCERSTARDLPPIPPFSRSPPSPGADSRDWSQTNECVRDLHRVMMPSESICTAATADDLSLPKRLRLHPEIGTASELAQPGGFRRAHILTTRPTGASPEYARRPLSNRLQSWGFTSAFVMSVMQTLPDGTEVLYESRKYRRGRHPEILRARSTEHLMLSESWIAEDTRLRQRPMLWVREIVCCGPKTRHVPFNSSLNFFIGALLFTVGSLDWMMPNVGDEEHGATAKDVAFTVTYPYAVGAIFFIVGCYLAFVEVLNANLTEEVKRQPEGLPLNLEGSVHRPSRTRTISIPSPPGNAGDTEHGLRQGREHLLNGLNAPLPEHDDAVIHECCGTIRQLRWWGWQPRSVLYWGSLAQFIGSVLFAEGCISQLPCFAGLSHSTQVWVLYAPSVVASVGFVFCGYVYLVETTHRYNCFMPPKKITIGYFVALLNFVGSVLYLVASCLYFAQVPPWNVTQTWEFYMSEWGVKFGYGVGSVAFVLSSMLGMREALSH